MDTRVYAGYADGLRVVDPETGSVSVRLADRAVECLSVAPTGGNGERPGSEDADYVRVLAGTSDAGLFRSTDGGERFERVAAETLGPGGSGPAAVTAVATSPHDPAVVWVGTEPSRAYRSTDGGETVERVGGLSGVPSASEWSYPPRPDTHHVRWIEPCPADPERWFVGVEAGALVVTPDGGETWLDRPEGSRRDNHALATHPSAPDRVYAAAGDGFAESDDRGDSWSVVDRGLDHGYVWGLAVDPGDPETALVSAAPGATAAHRRGEAYLYRRVSAPLDAERDRDAASGSGPRFERLDDRGIPTGEGTYPAVLASGRTDGAIWAVHDDGLYRTRDAGESFERIPADLPSSPARSLAVE
ncbi:WD40/YVTN/BNR-like repeat-containing protein [Halorubrum lipolyticum]|uniref:Glycosyl hydrolase n=1 Tax=Halorubrum lipolyticum DSM 21995 TaxID=1227482 RepID=M0NY40_9EURY|nr:hypothetical protein [Halorubrum lipolyticum]EMA61470.1 hypothetical protein C469_07221 [Halorubrum lipolyticum DSM 21995]